MQAQVYELPDLRAAHESSVEAEMGVIGSMLLSKKAVSECLASLMAGDFWRPAHRQIFAVMSDLDAKGAGIDFLTVRSEIERRGQLQDIGGDDYLLQIAEYVPSALNALHYAGIVADYSARRSFRAKGKELANLASDPEVSVDQIRGFVEGIGKVGGGSLSPFIELGSVAIGDGDKGESTGYACLDALVTTRGFPCGQLTMVRAYHKGGKTMFMTNCAIHAARMGKRVLYMTFADLDASQLKRRIMKHITGWGKRPFNLEAAADFDKALEEINVQWDFTVYDAAGLESGAEVETAISWARSVHECKPFDLVFVDYAQELRTCERAYGDYERQNICASKMNFLARRLKCPVVVGSQMTQGKEGEKAKTKGSRTWEEKAGLVLSLEKDKSMLQVEVTYSRFGGQNVRAHLNFVESHLRFDDPRIGGAR